MEGMHGVPQHWAERRTTITTFVFPATRYGCVITFRYKRLVGLMRFLKGAQEVIKQDADLPIWEDQSATISRQMSELFDVRNLSFLFGSGCSSMSKDKIEHGIPTMGPLAAEFCGWFDDAPDPLATVTLEQKAELLEKVGIDLTADDYRKNLERLMDVLLNAERFCDASADVGLNGSVPLIRDVITGVQEFVLRKCTAGKFTTDNSVVDTYRSFYRSLSTRGRGLRPPWVELCLNLGDALHQAARFSASSVASTPSLNLVPSMTFGNWFLPLSRSHFFDAA
jgi:hypothetical protein